MTDAESLFKDAMRAAGLTPPHYIPLETILRFPGVGKSPRNRAGFCRMYGDREGGFFGDWSCDLFQLWSLRSSRALPPAEQVMLLARRQLEHARYLEDLRARQATAEKQALRIWAEADLDVSSHRYPFKKGIQPYGARLHQDALVLQVASFEGAMTSLQFIVDDAFNTKRLLKSGRKQGCFIPVSEGDGTALIVIICEGWATGCTLAEHYPNAVVLAAIDAGNLEAVALGARARWPAAHLLIAGDDDRLTPGNPGATKARAAALAAGADLRLPEWPSTAPNDLSDFNDFANWLRGHK